MTELLFTNKFFDGTTRHDHGRSWWYGCCIRSNTTTSKQTSALTFRVQIGLGQLTKMLNEHMDQMKSKDVKVEKFINNFASSTLLKDAKEKAVETETKILKSIMDDIMNMTDFLNNIVLIENLFNREYAPHKKEQEEARAKYAPNIAKYETKPKVNSEVASFVELMFGGQTVHAGNA